MRELCTPRAKIQKYRCDHPLCLREIIKIAYFIEDNQLSEYTYDSASGTRSRLSNQVTLVPISLPVRSPRHSIAPIKWEWRFQAMASSRDFEKPFSLKEGSKYIMYHLGYLRRHRCGNLWRNVGTNASLKVSDLILTDGPVMLFGTYLIVNHLLITVILLE